MRISYVLQLYSCVYVCVFLLRVMGIVSHYVCTYVMLQRRMVCVFAPFLLDLRVKSLQIHVSVLCTLLTYIYICKPSCYECARV